MAAKKRHPVSQVKAVGQGHAAFAGGDDLDRVEAEHGDVAVAAIADWLVLVFAAYGVGGVFDDLETVLLT